jgi:CRISPR-associated protein Csm5
VSELQAQLAQARDAGQCLVSLGWGGGLLTKSAWLDTTAPDYRKALEQFSIYNRALASNLPFPKTRRVVFVDNKPAALPGWARVEITES